MVKQNKFCKYCRSKHNLTIHHVDGNPNNDIKDNRRTLCRSCHDEVHGIEDRKRRHHINAKYKPGTPRSKRK